MTILQFINTIREIPILSIRELSEEEYRMYIEKKRDSERKPPVVRVKKEKIKKEKIPKETKQRKDKGKTRAKYDSNLPPVYKRYISRANRKGLEFQLSVEEFEEMISKPCVYCKEPATGIDRRNNKLGYTTYNSRPCCSKCNWMKGTLTEEQFIEQCKKILGVYYNDY